MNSNFYSFIRTLRPLALILCVAVLLGVARPAYSSATVVTLTSGTSWTVPAGVSSIVVEVWGPGGGGGTGFSGPVSDSGAGGGGGGGYAKKTIVTVSGTLYSITIPGTTAAATNGGNTTFGGILTGGGGNKGGDGIPDTSEGAGGSGGVGSGGDVNQTGTAGSPGTYQFTAPGGAGGAGASGGAGGAGAPYLGGATAGTAPGGGGGGGYGGGTGGGTPAGSGATGGGGQIRITYFATGVTLTKATTITKDANVIGALSKGSGTFVIDDPIDPLNKLLFHSFVESPDVKNIYDGIVTLDSRGAATIELPDYFLALNEDFRYLATPVGSPMPNLHLSQEVGKRYFGIFGAAVFAISGGSSNGRVSWQVTGNRHDPYILAHPIIPEVDKGPGQLVDKGQYLFPEAYGK